MRISKTFCRTQAAIIALLLIGLNAYASNGKRITFTTKSEEARQQLALAIKAIESFQFGPDIQGPLQKAIAADPDFAFAQYLLSANMPPPQAREQLAKALELAKNASEGERRYIEAIALLRSQKGPEALAAFQELAKQFPEDRMVQMMIGQISLNQGKFDVAKAAFERASSLDASTPRVHTFLGNIHLLRGDYAKARDLFKASLARKREGTAPFGPNYGLAYTYIYEGDVKSALAIMQGYKVDYDKTPGAQNFPPVFIWNSIGRLLLENGKAEESIKAYEAGYATIPASNLPEVDKKTWLGRLHHGKGRALAKLGKHEEAWKEAELIKKMIDEAGEEGKPFMPAYHYIAGYLKLESGDYAKAVEHLKQADLTDNFHRLLLARAYEKSGDQASAQKLYKQIVDSTDVTLERALAYPEAKKKLKS